MEIEVLPSYPPFHPKSTEMTVKRMFDQRKNLETTIKRRHETDNRFV